MINLNTNISFENQCSNYLSIENDVNNNILIASFLVGTIDFNSATHVKNENELNDLFLPFQGGVAGNAITFDNNSKEFKELFDNLKIDSSAYSLIKCDNKNVLVKNSDRNLSKILEMKEKLGANPIIKYKILPKPTPDLSQSGVAVLSMNQTNSFTSYSNEILTFLLDGVNVLVYDNAGKGLSTGDNSQQGLKEAVEVCGEYLLKSKGFSEDKILFKGQCAGGLPSSEAAKTFPMSHVWIDQSPKNFCGVAGSLFAGEIKKWAENKDEDSSLSKKLYSLLNSTSGIVCPVVGVASKLVLPSFDVTYNLSYNKGMQLYTIGVPDSQGEGGDDLVPVHHREEIKSYMESKPNGHYLPMEGATHVTNWWLNKKVYKEANDLLAQAGLSQKIYAPKQVQTNEELVNQKYGELMGSPFNPNEASKINECIHSLLLSVVQDNMDKFS